MTKCTAVANSSVAIAYVRASKREQRLSPEAQGAAIESWAARERVPVAEWYIDHGVRGITPLELRPALCGALSAVRQYRSTVLVVAKRDRIARDVVLAASIERAVAMEGARIVSASGEGNGDSARSAGHRATHIHCPSTSMGIVSRTATSVGGRSSYGSTSDEAATRVAKGSAGRRSSGVRRSGSARRLNLEALWRGAPKWGAVGRCSRPWWR
jgi:hypothetical protein